METRECDLAVIGGGPAGLCATIHASSEGLRTVLVDSKPGLGGQAKNSSLIENYPGFPNGISGSELMQLFGLQAERFDADILCPTTIRTLAVDGHHKILTTDYGDVIVTNAVILTCGLSLTQLPAKHVPVYLGHGVSYGPSYIDPNTHRCIAVVGGKNSAGQAAMHASKYQGCVVKLIVRGNSIDDMSQYLVDRIKATPNIEVMFETEVAEVKGDGQKLTDLVLKQGNVFSEVQADLLQIFIGGRPKTAWLNGILSRDDHEFIVTGSRITNDKWELQRPPFGFETSIPGVFAAGDVRSTSTKRIAAAAGEGSVAVQMLHNYLHQFHDDRPK